MNSESPEIPGSTTLQDLRRSNRNYGNGFSNKIFRTIIFNFLNWKSSQNREKYRNR